MNLRQAARAIGFRGNLKLAGEIDRAADSCKALVVEARRGGDDKRAAQLSEVWQVFKKHRQNRCEVCGVKVTHGATRCRMHQNPGRKQLISVIGSEPQPKRRGQQRCDVAPEGGLLATMGYYTSDVQKVVGKWLPEVRREWLENYFSRVALAVTCKNREADLRVAIPNHWQCVFELGSAIARVYADKSKADGWLLRLPISVATNGAFPSWPEIAATIKQAGGPRFTPAALKQAAKRMRLLTPPAMAKEFSETTGWKP